jgi:hypothetical protein
MGRPAFDTTLVLAPRYDPNTGDTRVSPLARGPVDPGDVIRWIAVWIFWIPDVGPGAAASGVSDYEQTFTDPWQLETFLAKGSDDFLADELALAMALALIWRGGDEKRKEFYWWVDPVKFVKESE